LVVRVVVSRVRDPACRVPAPEIRGDPVSNSKVTKLKPAHKPARALDTPTDLDNAAVKAVSEALNGLLATSYALYLKTKNFHWHVSGPHFRDYHLMLDEQAADILGATDDMAERVRKIGGTTLRSIGHIAKLQTIEDNNDDFVPPGMMLRELMNDNKQVAEDMRKAHEICEDHDDPATASMIEIWLDQTEKRTWFLFEAARGASNDGH
jgi:starvation-inducible DNA-binding protein